MKQTLYINLYRAGFYHRQGKPNTTNLHGGDVYTSEKLALENAEPDRGYITTVPFEVDMPGTVLANGPQHEADPLHFTRRAFEDGNVNHRLLPYLSGQRGGESSTPLEVGDGHYGVGYDEWYAAQHGVVWHREPQP